jgi:hypothetical protein
MNQSEQEAANIILSTIDGADCLDCLLKKIEAYNLLIETAHMRVDIEFAELDLIMANDAEYNSYAPENVIEVNFSVKEPEVEHDNEA